MPLLPPTTVAAALRTPGVDPVDARILLQHVLDVDHAALIAHDERELDEVEAERFATLVARRRTGEPVAYLLGWREFYGRVLAVGPAVLIPRPETELLVELALERLGADRAPRVLDLGTGSGNVAVTLALERPEAAVTAVERSAAALAVAAANAARLGAVSMRLLSGDWFSCLGSETFDLIVSNPPYVAAGDPHLARGDLRFEPEQALTSGADGLDDIRRIVAAGRSFLAPGGWLLFEHGYDQGPAARDLLTDAGYGDVFTRQDLAGLDRVSGGRRND